jgi:hypothetical protein
MGGQLAPRPAWVDGNRPLPADSTDNGEILVDVLPENEFLQASRTKSFAAAFVAYDGAGTLPEIVPQLRAADSHSRVCLLAPNAESCAAAAA